MSANTPVAAFFDLDKTIIATSSAFAFGKEFLHNGMITRQEAWDLYLSKAQYMLMGQSSEKMDSTRDALAQMVAGWEVDDIQRITRDTLREVVAPAIYAEARELIDAHKAKGHHIIIISASAKILVEPIAQELGVDTVVATEMAIENGKLTGEITRYLKGEAKAEAVRQFAADHSFDLDASFAYSDSATDIPMLELVGNPVAVNPDRALKKHALANGWQARTFKNPEPLIQMPNAREVGIGAGVIAGVTALAVAGVLIARAVSGSGKGAGEKRRSA
ncbi:HAD-IB family hydrolase [Corynebacterium sp. zg912]|uniref:HAD family hydrolase n=1 Tax=Corynebacterium wankanglinii TaxID=2735136 RepID=A0A7H0KAH0_9CORY|nr:MULTISPECIES: HAD family hydrolase [Corynebacterium]MBA1836378.1 HAD family hydrolase [Corynebacterium wankanglinii]MCR5928373.1 HAD-IB family hydrolase [Corynebacterium sp. zg912]QNP94286.1 HAD family hydrolase [Corynebacterium wankanglinii]